MSRRNRKNRSSRPSTKTQQPVKFMFATATGMEFLTLEDLVAGHVPQPYDFAAQFMGFSDADGAEIYQGDVLEIDLCADLPDGFRRSKVGKAALAMKEAYAVAAFMPRCGSALGECCRVYAKLPGGEMKRLHTADPSLPEKLCGWGAVCVASALGYASDSAAMRYIDAQRKEMGA